MAVKGSCVKSTTRYQELGITAYTWVATADAAGDCTDNDVVDADWLHYKVSGTIISVLITYTDCDNAYDFYVKDSQGIDILKAKGVNLANAATGAGNRFCPMLTSDLTNEGMPMVLIDETLEFVGDEMGNVKVGAITLFVKDIENPRFR